MSKMLTSTLIAALLLLTSPARADKADDIIAGFVAAYAASNGAAVGALYATSTSLESPAFPAPLTTPTDIANAEGFLFGSFCNPVWAPVNTLKKLLHRELAVEYTLTVDFCGPFPGPDGNPIAPTGATVVVKGSTFITYDSAGKITKEVRYADLLGLYLQLGWTP